MILKKHPHNVDSFQVLNEDTLTKQQVADHVWYTSLKTHTVKFVAQKELESAAGYMLEDDQGLIHTIGYKMYTDLKLDQLFLPPIVLPKPTMTLEEALVVMVKFAPISIELEKADSFNLPTDFIIAREVLGGREAGMQVFSAIVQIFKTRK